MSEFDKQIEEAGEELKRALKNILNVIEFESVLCRCGKFVTIADLLGRRCVDCNTPIRIQVG